MFSHWFLLHMEKVIARTFQFPQHLIIMVVKQTNIHVYLKMSPVHINTVSVLNGKAT